jgi:hypothetical protein
MPFGTAFALTIQSALERADAVYAHANALVLHDDVRLVGAASGVRSALHELPRGAAAIGLSIATWKCLVYGRNPVPAAETARNLGLQQRADGIVVAGCLVGNSENTSCRSTGVAAQVCVLLNFLKAMPACTPAPGPLLRH